jgi:hypothetical protein
MRPYSEAVKADVRRRMSPGRVPFLGVKPEARLP